MDQVQRQVRKQERCEMIESKSLFYAIDGVFLFREGSAHVIDQHVNSRQLLMKTRGEIANRSLGREVCDKESGGSRGDFGNCFQCDVSSIGVSANQDYACPLLCQSQGTGETYSGICSCDYDYFVLRRHIDCSLPESRHQMHLRCE